MEVRFVADSSLGKLAKWLRVMGYDTIYQSFYREETITELIHKGRTLLSRQRATVTQHPTSLLIRSDHVETQLHEMKRMGAIAPDRSKWFTRCLICNVPLEEANATVTHQNVPEYVFHQSRFVIRFCPSCGRHFWPGTHRKRMNRQLEEWGF